MMLSVLPILFAEIAELQLDGNRLASTKRFFLCGEGRLEIVDDFAHFPDLALAFHPGQQLIHRLCGFAIERFAETIQTDDGSNVPAQRLFKMAFSEPDT